MIDDQSSDSNFSSSGTRASLLMRARNQDEHAWTELVDLYGPLVAHSCRNCGLDPHTSADCIRDVFSSVARKIKEFKPARKTGSFRAWLWTITSNKIRDRARADKRRAEARGGSTALKSLQHIADPITIPDSATSEVAKEFDVSPSTVRQTRSRILRRLRSHLGDCD